MTHKGGARESTEVFYIATQYKEELVSFGQFLSESAESAS